MTGERQQPVAVSLSAGLVSAGAYPAAVSARPASGSSTTDETPGQAPR